MQKWRVERNFLEKKLKMVRKALQQLKKDKKITDFRQSGSLRFARRMGIDFYAVYIDGREYITRPLWIVRDGEENKSNKTIWVSPFENEASLRKRILQTIGRL